MKPFLLLDDEKYPVINLNFDNEGNPNRLIIIKEGEAFDYYDIEKDYILNRENAKKINIKKSLIWEKDIKCKVSEDIIKLINKYEENLIDISMDYIKNDEPFQITTHKKRFNEIENIIQGLEEALNVILVSENE